MTKLRIAAASLNQTPMAWNSNRDNILAAIDEAREAEAAIVCLPELCISGYGCEDAFLSPGVQQTAIELLVEIIPETKGIAVALGLPLTVDGVLYNAAAYVCDGQLLGFICKQHLAGDGIHYEPRWFKPWPSGEVSDVSIEGASIPAGDLLFNTGGVIVGMEICRDAWVDNRPGANLAARGADIILNPSASHFAFAKQEVRREIVLSGSRDFHTSYVYTNLLGNESGRAIYDGGTLIASRGKMVAVGPRFSYADRILTVTDIDVAATRADRKKASKNLSAVGGITVDHKFTFQTPAKSYPAASRAKWDTSPPTKAEEFARAVPLALYDYLRKARAGGFVVSLSGGADSATVATMVWLMVELGIADVGREAFVEKISHITAARTAEDTESLVHALLTCVYQSTRQSSQTTRDAACCVSLAFGARFLEWNVDAMVDGYVDTVSQVVDRKLNWETDDLALQNIQARVRGPGAWLLANLTSSLLLATSNRSEAAVGYATMDGDTCGGLSPIAGIDKAFLLEWLGWMQSTGPAGVGPLAALSVVTDQQPTAELRPAEQSQTDEGDLMPYRVLDAIERAAIRDRLLPVEAFETVAQQFSEYSRKQLGDWVVRFFQLWSRNQWKRERYAPSFHLDDENLDPKTWCRFPILSGGYERELAELRKLLGGSE